MAGAIFDAVLGRFFNDGVELELGAGVDCTSGITASRNAATRRIDLSVTDPGTGASYVGDTSAIAAGAGTVDAAINGSATKLAVSSLVAAGSAVDLEIRVWIAKADGTWINRDTLRVVLYRETASSEMHIVDTSVEDNSDVSAGTAQITIAGTGSGVAYNVTATYAGNLEIAVLRGATIARTVQVSIWKSAAFVVPTS